MHFYACERPRYYHTKLGRKNIGRIHRVKVSGLTPGTTCCYRIFSQEVTENKTMQVCYGAVASTDVLKGVGQSAEPDFVIYNGGMVSNVDS